MAASAAEKQFFVMQTQAYINQRKKKKKRLTRLFSR
jgi:hypothetical protein